MEIIFPRVGVVPWRNLFLSIALLEGLLSYVLNHCTGLFTWIIIRKHVLKFYISNNVKIIWFLLKNIQNKFCKCIKLSKQWPTWKHDIIVLWKCGVIAYTLKLKSYSMLLICTMKIAFFNSSFKPHKITYLENFIHSIVTRNFAWK